MSAIKKTFLGFFVLSLVLVFSGCGEKEEAKISSPVSETKIKTTENVPEEKKTSSPSENLPAPTGKVSDAVGSVLDATNMENAEISQEENDALSSISDEEETDDFGQSYDEDEF